MPNLPVAEEILVSIAAAIVQASPPAWHLDYDVRNQGTAAIWLVVDENLVVRWHDRRIELSYARSKMQPGVTVFAYFDPATVKIPPNASLRQSVNIRWPCHLSDLWNPVREVAPAHGDYEVTVRIGFARTPAPLHSNPGEDVEEAVLRWQKEAVSVPVQMTIPPDASATGSGAVA